MAFDENDKKIENVYEKMIAHLPEEVTGDEYYQYYYNLLETGTNYVDFFNSRLLKSIDEEWVNAIEETLIPLQHVVANPRSLLKRTGKSLMWQWQEIYPQNPYSICCSIVI